jgi:pimeloyl-ACP methyl ester carboxylesterase
VRWACIAIWAWAAAHAGVAGAQDLERERRLAEQTVDAVFDGEPLFLRAGDIEFLAIYMEAQSAPARGAALLLHGRGFHPDWEEVVRPLRTALPAHGWHTLSLQMPVLAKDAKYYDYVPIFPAAYPRIEAGLAFLKEQGIDNVVVIAHSCGVHMSMAYVEEHGDAGFDAYVGIGMGATDYGQPMAAPFPLSEMKVPVLDLHGSAEYPAVLRMAPRRLAAMREAGSPLSRQVVIDGAGHYFRGHETELVEAVVAWLETLGPR